LVQPKPKALIARAVRRFADVRLVDEMAEETARVRTALQALQATRSTSTSAATAEGHWQRRAKMLENARLLRRTAGLRAGVPPPFLTLQHLSPPAAHLIWRLRTAHIMPRDADDLKRSELKVGRAYDAWVQEQLRNRTGPQQPVASADNQRRKGYAARALAPWRHVSRQRRAALQLGAWPFERRLEDAHAPHCFDPSAILQRAVAASRRPRKRRRPCQPTPTSIETRELRQLVAERCSSAPDLQQSSTTSRGPAQSRARHRVQAVQECLAAITKALEHVWKKE
jgi:hypothetical protein